MPRYLVRRLLQTGVLLLVVSLVVFALVTQAPGGPGILLDRNMAPEDIARMRALLGLDQPLPVQYVRWLGQVLVGNLGVSYQAGVPVLEIIGQMLPNTLLLSAAALALTLVVAVPAGVISAARPYSATDHGVTFLALFGISVPTFWFGLMLIVLFSVSLGWFPPGGMRTIGAPASLLDMARHLVLPAIVLGSANMALVARYTRSATLAVLREDYVRTARAKGRARARRPVPARPAERPAHRRDRRRPPAPAPGRAAPPSPRRSSPGRGWAAWRCARRSSAITR